MFLSSLLVVAGLGAAVAAERPGGDELAQSVTDHILGDVDGDVLPAVMHRYRQKGKKILSNKE